MTEDYESAAVRHFKDATTLKQSGRTDNAGHLVGFAAECAIKHRIQSLRPSANSPHGHFPELLIAARKHLGPRGGYTEMYNIVKNDIFQGWTTDRRYMVTGHTTETDLNLWFETTRRLLAVAKVKVRQ